MDNLFVYGSLKKGFKGHDLLSESRLIGTGRTYGLFCMYDMGKFPMVTDRTEVTNIKGEVYRVPGTFEFWKIVDSFEGIRFFRTKVPIIIDGSGTLNAWIYLAVDEITEGMLIRDGSWENKS